MDVFCFVGCYASFDRRNIKVARSFVRLCQAAATCGEHNPEAHKKLLLEMIAREKPDLVVLCHSSYGWDLAPRVAPALTERIKAL